MSSGRTSGRAGGKSGSGSWAAVGRMDELAAKSRTVKARSRPKQCRLRRVVSMIGAIKHSLEPTPSPHPTHHGTHGSFDSTSLDTVVLRRPVRNMPPAGRLEELILRVVVTLQLRRAELGTN